MQAIRDAIYDLVAQEWPMTVRQVFYQLVSQAVIEKKESEYKNTVCRLLAQMRRSQTIPFRWISDNTRWMRKPESYASMQSFLWQSQRFYRRDLWEEQDAYVEIWLEKEALAGVLVQVTEEWDVPLMVTRGYPSISFLHSAAEAINCESKPAFLYYFGDHDPSGVDIPRFVEENIRELAPNADITFECVAVTPDQIVDMDLPTRPTKKTDSRAKRFEGESVEVDAIPPRVLRDICRHCIEQHVDYEALESTRRSEHLERETLEEVIENMGFSL